MTRVAHICKYTRDSSPHLHKQKETTAEKTIPCDLIFAPPVISCAHIPQHNHFRLLPILFILLGDRICLKKEYILACISTTVCIPHSSAVNINLRPLREIAKNIHNVFFQNLCSSQYLKVYSCVCVYPRLALTKCANDRTQKSSFPACDLHGMSEACF